MEDRTPITEVAEKAPEKKPIEPIRQKGELGYMDNLEYHRFADDMGLSYEDRKDFNLAEKLSFLSDWAKEKTGSTEQIEHVLALKHLVKNLGWNDEGKGLIKKLYQYVRLDSQRKSIEKRMEIL